MSEEKKPWLVVGDRVIVAALTCDETELEMEMTVPPGCDGVFPAKGPALDTAQVIEVLEDGRAMVRRLVDGEMVGKPLEVPADCFRLARPEDGEGYVQDLQEVEPSLPAGERLTWNGEVSGFQLTPEDDTSQGAGVTL